MVEEELGGKPPERTTYTAGKLSHMQTLVESETRTGAEVSWQ
jgi:hypothetical protein